MSVYEPLVSVFSGFPQSTIRTVTPSLSVISLNPELTSGTLILIADFPFPFNILSSFKRIQEDHKPYFL